MAKRDPNSKASKNPKGICKDERRWTTWRLWEYYKNNTPEQNAKLFQKLRGSNLTVMPPIYLEFKRFIIDMDGFVGDKNGNIDKSARDAAIKLLVLQTKSKGAEVPEDDSLNAKEAKSEVDAMSNKDIADLLLENISPEKLAKVMKEMESNG
jgi:hypothetical protein